MPRGDRTGPWGYGRLTGRAAGYCAGYSVPGFMNPIRGFGRGFGRGLGRGFGRGWGRGFGRDWWVYPTVPMRSLYSNHIMYPLLVQPPSPEQEAAVLEKYTKELEAEKADLEQAMNQIKSRIEELKATLKQ